MQPHTAPRMRLICGNFIMALLKKHSHGVRGNKPTSEATPNLNGFWEAEEEEADSDAEQEDLVRKTKDLQILGEVSLNTNKEREAIDEKELERLYREIDFSDFKC